ncbi:MAG: hypothetical protein JNM18_07570 [Planctomycetaceae bacterium]|nr:hypothetical protein [Planctomycetaceae bacterium]
MYHRLDEEIRSRIEAHLAREFPHLQVKVRSAQVVAGEGIVVRGVSMVQPTVAGPLGELAAVDEVFVSCNTDLTDIVRGNLGLRKVIVRRPTVRLWRYPDGSWSVAQMIPKLPRNARPPPIVIDDGTYEIYNFDRPELPALRLREAQLTFQATIEQPLVEGGRSPVRLQGTCATDFVREAKLDALIDPDGRAWRAGGGFDAFEINPHDWDAVPGVGLPVPELLRNFRATGTGSWAADYVAGRDVPLQFNLTGKVADGRIDDPRLVYPVTELRTDLSITQAGMRLANLSARHGQAVIQADIERFGFATQSPLRLLAQVRRLHLDNKLLHVLPDKWQSEWHKYMPVGEVDADVNIEFDGVAWRPQINVNCTNVSFTHFKFPYRLERGRGTIEMKGPAVSCNLTAFSDNAEIRIAAQVTGPQSPPAGWIEVRGEHARFDEKLLFALPEKAAQVVRSMHLAGGANFVYRWVNDPAQHAEPQQTAQVALNRCSVRLDKFPYPIDEVMGVVEMQNKSWTFRDLRGGNDKGRIVLNGQFAPATSGGYDLTLQAAASQIALEDQLHDALSPGARQFWEALRPRGMLNLTVDLRRLAADPQTRVWIRAEPVENTLSVEPVQFPYRLESCRGVYVYSDGHVTVDGFTAQHGRATLTARGIGDLLPAGGWTLHLEHFHWDRLIADREFVAALPGRLKKVVSDLDIKGPVSLHGAVDLVADSRPGEPFRSEWDVHADFQQAVINCGVRFDDVNGSVNLAGNFDGKQFRCRGDIALDSLIHRDHQITDVRGPLWIDDTRLLLGYWADRVRDVKPERRLTARMYGGAVIADGWLDLSGEPHFQVNATLNGADLAQFARQVIPGQRKLSGEATAQLELRGRASNVNDLTGSGSIQLRNANIYELPLMVSMLKILSTVPPDNTAFTSSDIDFRVQGEHLYVERMELNGDAISLLGNGEVGLNKQINMAFYAVVGRDESRPLAMRNLLGGASRQIMQIHAEGTLDQPLVRREAFPAVSQALQQFQAEMQSREDARQKAQAARRSWLNLGR